MKKTSAILSLAILGLMLSNSAQAGFYPDSVYKICKVVPKNYNVEDSSNVAADRAYLKCLEAQLSYLDTILKQSMEEAISSVQDASTKAQLQQDYDKRFRGIQDEDGSAKSESNSDNEPITIIDEALDKRRDTTLDIMKVLGILVPTKYPKSRYRIYLEKEDLENTYKEALSKVQDKASLEANQKAWIGYKEEFCNPEVLYPHPGAYSEYQELRCQDIMNRIRTQELASKIGKH